jgi:hypothetical protein
MEADMGMRRHDTGAYTGGSIVGGIILMTIGVVFLLDNFNVLAAGAIVRWWPLLLIIIGGARLFRRSRWYEKEAPYTDFGPSKN